MAPEQLGAEAVDDRTLVLTLARPYPYLTERLLYPTAYPVPQHVIERVGDDWVKPQHWVSNGAYRLASWQPQGAVTLQRNEHFAASGLPAPVLERVDYLPLANEQAAYSRYRAGEVDAIASFPAGELPRVRRTWPSTCGCRRCCPSCIWCSTPGEPPFDDARVREALALVVDRETLTERCSGPATCRAQLRAGPGPRLRTGAGARRRLAAGERLDRRGRCCRKPATGRKVPLGVTIRHASGTEASAPTWPSPRSGNPWACSHPPAPERTEGALQRPAPGQLPGGHGRLVRREQSRSTISACGIPTPATSTTAAMPAPRSIRAHGRAAPRPI
jgi:hypothetical protein